MTHFARSRDNAGIPLREDRGTYQAPAEDSAATSLRSCYGMSPLLARLRDLLGMTNHSFWFFHYVAQVGRIRVAAHLAFENRRRVGRNELVPFQDELRINPIAGGLIDFVAT